MPSSCAFRNLTESCFSAADPSACGGVFNGYQGQITEQPTWMVMDGVNLAGVTPTRTGYRISPQLPGDFSLRFETVGVARQGRVLRGYVRPVSGGPLTLEVTVPGGATHVVAWEGSSAVPVSMAGRVARFGITTTGGRATDWAVTWS